MKKLNISKYRDGSSTFPHHTDPDAFLESTSNIYNVLIDAEREVEFMNLTGPINPLRIKISDGSIYSIPASSQGSWSRCLISNPSIKKPVIFITFRKLRTPPPRDSPPPLGLPGQNINIKIDILMGKHKVAGKTTMTRTLFLWDSILSSVSSQSLKINSRDMCIKKMLYYLTDFSNYEPEFEYSDKVIISSGINDITRRYLSPEIVSDVVLPQIT